VAKAFGGSVLITHPHSGAMVTKGPVEIEGSHKNARGHFWLITFAKDQYWPQTELDLRPGGNWRAKTNKGTHPGPRTSNLLLIRLSDFANTLLHDIQNRSNKANFYDPIKIDRPPERPAQGCARYRHKRAMTSIWPSLIGLTLT
jgi:hypothetical protein